MHSRVVQVPEVLLPARDMDLTRWAVVACDQFTAQPEYWAQADRIVGEVPSTLRLVYPEAFLGQSESQRIAGIHSSMKAYLEGNVFADPHHGFILTERTTEAGVRIGLVAAIDLTAYDFSVGAKSLIRPTEGTVLDRIPPRVRVRKGAPLETPHVMLLADDPNKTLLEPLYARRLGMKKLYDFELMLGGGHLRGWAVEDDEAVLAAMDALPSLVSEDPVLFAVGDGNHSLATARQCYLDNPTEGTRFALVEIVNLYDPSLVFEPIHRLIENAEERALLEEASACGIQLDGGDVRQVQPFLDEFLPGTARMDYIHGEEALRSLSEKTGFFGIRLSAIDKATLFPSIQNGRVLPRKAFSMGEANQKRYYMECRALKGR